MDSMMDLNEYIKKRIRCSGFYKKISLNKYNIEYRF